MKKIIELIPILSREQKKQIQKYLLIAIGINTILFAISFLTPWLSTNEIVKNIIGAIVGIGNIAISILILKETNSKKEEEQKNQEKIILTQYDPIFLEFLMKSEVKISKQLVISQLLDLTRRGHLGIRKDFNGTVFYIKNSEVFKRTGSFEGIQNEDFKEYISGDIKPYENIIITKILFAFSNQISIKEIDEKIQNNYYQERCDMAKFIFDKMLIYEAQKQGILKKRQIMKPFLIVLIAHIVITIFGVLIASYFNIICIIATLINIGIDSIMLYNEKIFSYNFSKSTIQKVESLKQYIKSKTIEECETKEEKINCILINKKNIEIKNIEEFIEK